LGNQKNYFLLWPITFFKIYLFLAKIKKGRFYV